MYDIIIVGAGPAGLTAAIYALRANKKVLIFEAKACGGQILNASVVENYPGIISISGFDYSKSLVEQVKKLGGEIKFETVIKVEKDKKVYTEEGNYQAKAVIIATGASNRKLNIENEEDFVGKGVSYCASCDGNFFKGKDVAVVGGGNTALEDAIYLSNIAKKVYIIHRRDTFRGERKLVKDVQSKDNIEIILNSNVIKINGEKKLDSIDIKDNEEKVSNLKIDGCFIAVGQSPRNDIFANIVDLNDYGYIETIDDVHTKVDGIYVAGDTRVKLLRQLVTATSDGAIAATIAIKEMK